MTMHIVLLLAASMPSPFAAPLVLQRLTVGQVYIAARLSPLQTPRRQALSVMPQGILDATVFVQKKFPGEVDLAVIGPWVAQVAAKNEPFSEIPVVGAVFNVTVPGQFWHAIISAEDAAALYRLSGLRERVGAQKVLDHMFDFSRMPRTPQPGWDSVGWENPFLLGLAALDRNVFDTMVLSPRMRSFLEVHHIDTVRKLARDLPSYSPFLDDEGRREIRAEFERMRRQMQFYSVLTPAQRARFERRIDSDSNLSGRTRTALTVANVQTYGQAAVMRGEQLRGILGRDSTTELRRILERLARADER